MRITSQVSQELDLIGARPLGGTCNFMLGSGMISCDTDGVVIGWTLDIGLLCVEEADRCELP